jgi:8-oxoguanine deaminase
VILANAWIVTMDDAGTEYERGWLRLEDGLVAELGPGDPPTTPSAAPPAAPPVAASTVLPEARPAASPSRAPSRPPEAPPRVGSEPPATRHYRGPEEGDVASRPLQQLGDSSTRDLRGAVVTPGLVNTHHHLFQTLTRARAQEADLFTWLRTLYPVWARLDDEMEYAAARAGLAELALSGCSTVFDHHYVFPLGVSGLIEAELQAARELGVRIVASRGSMDLGASDGGLPPDQLAEELDTVLADTERLAALADGDLVEIAVAPCSPFSVTTRLMEESAALARRLGLQLHTHLAETVEEEAYCRELYGCTPVEYLERVGWLEGDVWCAHCVHLSQAEIDRFAAHDVGVAHCPTSNLRLGAGTAPVRELLEAGARVGLGVDGSASNERGDLCFEVKQALLAARGRGGGTAMTARDALRLATRGGAGVLGRDDIGSLEPGRRADIAVWRTDGLELGGARDLVAGLVLSAPHRVDMLLVGGREVVRDGRLVNAHEQEIAREHRIQAARLWQ